MRQHLPLIILSVIGVGLIIVLALDVVERSRTNQLLEDLNRGSDQAISEAISDMQETLHEALQQEGQGRDVEPIPPPRSLAAAGPDTTPVVTNADPSVADHAPDGPVVDLPPADRWTLVSDIVTDIVTELLDGRYDTVVGRFDPPTARVLSRDDLAGIIDPIRTAKGRFGRIVGHRPTRTDLPPNLYACRVEVETDKGHIVVVTLTLDTQNRIAQLYVD